ncbi:MAG: hypothetical protein U1E77_16220 [Inhella sp.]
MSITTPLLVSLLANTAPTAPEPPRWEELHRHIEARVQADVARAEQHMKLAMEQVREVELQRLPADLFAGFELGRERVVKGAPYCADAVHETIQPLADGNRIVRKQSTRLCRDGEGRTRREVQRTQGDSQGDKLVYFRDPVAKESWVYNPESKAVRRLLGGVGMAWADVDHEAWQRWGREFSQRMREHFKDLPRPPVPPQAPKAPNAPNTPDAPAAPQAKPEPAVVVETDVTVKGAEGEPRRQRDVRVIRLSDLPAGVHMAPLPPMPPMPPMPALAGPGWSWGQFAPRGEAVVTPLPAKEIEGVKVTGERSTWTIEAGKLGNEKPIVISREVWTSPELSLTVYSRDFDPRSGEVVYRLQNIKRGEPDAALMKLPAEAKKPERHERRPAEPARKSS